MKCSLCFILLLAGLLISGGCELADPDTSQAGTEGAAGDTNTGGGTGDTGGGWRDGRTVGVIPASNGVVEWETQNVQVPPGLNTPGDAEWIIARVEGQGFARLLIMTMDPRGGRNPARILLEGPGGGFRDGLFAVPLPGVARWRVESGGGSMRIILNGNQIWSASGNFNVERAVMTDSGVRGFLGQWREVQ